MSLADEVYGTLEAAIAGGRYRPNQRLVEQDLARELGISRTPVREALHRLEALGFVDSGRQAWTVREHTPEEISHLFEVRIALESHAALLAAERATPAELAALAALHERAMPCDDLSRRAELVQLNDEFHAAVLHAAHNPPLEQLARQYHRHHFNYRSARLYTEEQARAAIDEHGEIVAALRAGDPPRARASVIRHLERSRELALRTA
jgi:DNA-binding GntR family transcriptional regulator